MLFIYLNFFFSRSLKTFLNTARLLADQSTFLKTCDGQIPQYFCQTLKRNEFSLSSFSFCFRFN